MADDGDRRTRLIAVARSFRDSNTTPTAAQVAQRAGISLSTYHRSVPSHAELLAEAGFDATPSSRDRLLQAAADLLGDVGFAGLQMDDVARRAGVSRGTLYRLFTGKAALLQALSRDRAPLAALGPMLQRVRDEAPEEVLPYLIAAATPRMLANRALMRAVLAQPNFAAPDRVGARGAIHTMFTEIGDYLAHQMELGRLRRTDPMTATLALLGPLYAYVVLEPELWFGDRGTRRPDDVIEVLLQTWLRGMQPEPAGEARPADHR